MGSFRWPINTWNKEKKMRKFERNSTLVVFLMASLLTFGSGGIAAADSDTLSSETRKELA